MKRIDPRQRAFQRWFICRPLREAARAVRRSGNERPRPPAAAQVVLLRAA